MEVPFTYSAASTMALCSQHILSHESRWFRTARSSTRIPATRLIFGIKVRKPLLICGPFHRATLSIYDRANEPKMMRLMDGVHHNDFLEYRDGTLLRYLQSLIVASPDVSVSNRSVADPAVRPPPSVTSVRFWGGPEDQPHVVPVGASG